MTTGATISGHTLIWSAGVAAPPLLNDIDFPKNALGYLDRQPDLLVKGQQNIWGIGDCASNPDTAGKPYPATAQHALREGLHAAKNIAAVYRIIKRRRSNTTTRVRWLRWEVARQSQKSSDDI